MAGIYTPIYTRYTVQAYNSATPDFSMVSDFASVEVFADTQEEAIEKAKKLITKKEYRISHVGEYYYDSRIDGEKKDE